MTKTTSFFLALLDLALVCLPPAADASGDSDYLGSCKKLSDRTIIISVFANDAAAKWDWKKRADYSQYKETHRRLGIAAEWIRKQAKASGAKTDLLRDFYNTPYLYVEAFFKENMQRITFSVYDIYQKWIDENGCLDFMKKHFQADSIIYAFYCNSPKSQNLASSALRATGRPLDNHIAICVFFIRGSTSSPLLPPMPTNRCTALAGRIFVAPIPLSICPRSLSTGSNPGTPRVCTP